MSDSIKRIFDTDIPRIMGVINCTPDSFYSGGRHPRVSLALEAARCMIDEGADILDIGGESSRPGSSYIDEREETERILPVIKGIREISDIPVSVDTRKAAVAERALDAGADMINDISALEDDPEMALLAAERKVPIVLMHKKGSPMTMQIDPQYGDPVLEISTYLKQRAEAGISKGIDRDKIILDPGIGFGKRIEDNCKLLASINILMQLGYPLLIGASRKSFIGTLLGSEGVPLPADERLIGTVSVHMWALLQGAAIIRVHDVQPHVEMRSIFVSLRRAGEAK